MSRYSGKCDLYDWIANYNNEKLLTCEIYIIENKTPISINNIKDLMPYYAHIVGTASGSKEKSIMHITKYPWLRYERVKYGISQMHYYYRKEMNQLLKENNLPLLYTEDECQKNFWSKTNLLGNLFLVETLYNDYKQKYNVLKTKDDELYLTYSRSKIDNHDIHTICKIDELSIRELKDKVVTPYTIFIKSEELYIGNYDIDTDSLILKTKTNKIGKVHLPKENFYIELKKR